MLHETERNRERHRDTDRDPATTSYTEKGGALKRISNRKLDTYRSKSCSRRWQRSKVGLPTVHHDRMDLSLHLSLDTAHLPRSRGSS